MGLLPPSAGQPHHRPPLGVDAEIVDLSVDFFTMHRTCWKLLRKVREENIDLFADLFGADASTQEATLPCVSAYLFLATATAEELARRSESAFPAALAQDTPMDQAGKIVEEFLRRNDGVLFNILKNRFGLRVAECSS